MSDLPARNLADVRLADLLEGTGCPVCAARGRAIDRFLESWLWESVNDVGVRRELDASRGLCPIHVRELVASDRRHSGSMLGSAILLDAMLRVRQAEIEAVRRARGGRARARALAAASQDPACLVCRVGDEAEASTIDGIGRHLEAAWAEATAQASFCVAHLVVLMRAARDISAWQVVEERQLERVASLHRTIGAFISHSAYDTRHLRTAEEVASLGRVAQLLGASDERPGAGHAGTRGGRQGAATDDEGTSVAPDGHEAT